MALPLMATSDKTLMIIGDKSLWTSHNGLEWSMADKTDWGIRHGAAYAQFNNQFIMTGGMRSWGNFFNDTWVSRDGVNWVQHPSPWPARRGHAMVEFIGKIWLIGGMVSSGKDNELPSQHLTDVWSTEDGIHWKQEMQDGPWHDGGDFFVQVMNDRLFMIRTTPGSVWSSYDGKHWRLLVTGTSWGSRRGAGAMTFDNKLWVFGGMDLHDVWNSGNGINWHLQTSAAPWSPRSANYCVVFKNKLWIFGGKTGRSDSWSGDIWAMGSCNEN